jgi:NAD(P)-dependent dehydrogenase (short-subunit alcohol dehydrogenase family)
MTRPVALITGGQQGIGLGIAEALAGAGFLPVAAAELAEDSLAVIEAQARVPLMRYLRHDLQSIGNAQDLLDRIERELGAVACYISNAGVPAKVRGDLLDLAPDSFDFVMGVNLRGAFFLAQEAARRMLAAPSDSYRSMIFVTSVSAEMASVERAEYCISKAGASMMARLFALRLAPHGIGVFELRPGIIASAMTAAVHDTYTARIEGGLVPAGRWGEAADIGTVAAALASGQAAFATGAIIPVDGGLSIPRL